MFREKISLTNDETLTLATADNMIDVLIATDNFTLFLWHRYLHWDLEFAKKLHITAFVLKKNWNAKH